MTSLFKLAIGAVAAAGSMSAFALDNTVEAVYGEITPTFTQGFSHAFTGTPAPTEDKPVNWTGSPPTAGFNFYDDYLFTLSAASNATLSAAAITIDLGSMLGIGNLQARVYSIDTVADLTNGTPIAGTLAQAWSSPFNSNGLTGTVLAFSSLVPLQAGKTYALELRGLVTGSAGGSYGGNLNVSAVPEADAWALSLAGLGLLGVATRRRRMPR